jgi:hypothetical protein
MKDVTAILATDGLEPHRSICSQNLVPSVYNWKRPDRRVIICGCLQQNASVGDISAEYRAKSHSGAPDTRGCAPSETRIFVEQLERLPL